jgi:hypothetical protein
MWRNIRLRSRVFLGDLSDFLGNFGILGIIDPLLGMMLE